MLRKKVIFAVIVMTTVSIVSCTYMKQRLALKKCNFTIVSIEIQKFSLSGMTIGLCLGITNPNPIDVVIDKMDLDLYIENIKTIHVIFDAETIPSKHYKTTKAEVDVPFKTIGISGIAMKNGEKLRYKLSGMVYMNTSAGIIKFPVTISKS